MLDTARQSLPEFGVIGWPLHRTFSPLMFAAAFAQAGLEWHYTAIPLQPSDLGWFLQRAAREMRGFNVTIPHKAAVREACSVLDSLSQACGAVNTVVPTTRGGHRVLQGFNTDGPGLLKALWARAGLDPRGAVALVLGSGGAAAGCAAALAGAGAARVILANRTLRRAGELAEHLKRSYPATAWSAIPLDAPPAGCPGESTGAQPCPAIPGLLSPGIDLVVNCIPEEYSSQAGGLFHGVSGRKMVFCDMSYSTGPSRFLTAAREAGCRLVPGLEILLWQGTFGYEIMTGLSAPHDAMRDTLAAVAGGWWLDC